MAKRSMPEQIKLKCTICQQEVTPETYAEHVREFHSQPTKSPEPVAQVAAPVPQPTPYSSPIGPQQASVTPTAPPPPAPRNPFLNAQVLYANGGRISGRITGVRSSAGVKSKTRTDIADRNGWLIDIQTDKPVNAATKNGNGQLVAVTTNAVCGRVNEGDSRHQFLWKKYGPNWLGQSVTVRLPMPTDGATKAGWLIE